MLCWYIPYIPNILANWPFHSKPLRSSLPPQNSFGQLHPHASLFPQQPVNFIMSKTVKKEIRRGEKRDKQWTKGEICEILSQAELLNACVWILKTQIKSTPLLQYTKSIPRSRDSHTIQMNHKNHVNHNNGKGTINQNFLTRVLFCNSDLANLTHLGGLARDSGRGKQRMQIRSIS